MTSAWGIVDWDAPRPDKDALSRSRNRLRYVPVPLTGQATPAYLAAVNETHVNGGAIAARFRAVDQDSALHWFSSRNRFDEYGFFRHFLGSAAVRSALPQLGIPDPLGKVKLEESWSGTLSLDGEFAATIVRGGAYEKYRGTAAQAKLLAAACVSELVEDRHEDFHVYRSHAPWAAWFFDIAWDATWVIIDDRDTQVTLLCVTDTD